MENQSQTGKTAWVLPVLCVAAFMASLDLFIVNVAFSDIGQEFPDSSLADLSWILNAYAILYAALLVPLGRLADRFGQKAGFLSGLAVFTAASAACALSDSLWPLVAFRGIQAMGAALLTPTSLGLLLTATPADRKERAVRVWAATGGLAAAAGPVVGGLLAEASWRWIFLVNVPIGAAAFLLALPSLPASRHDVDTRLPDLPGAAVLLACISVLALGLVQAPSWGWDSPRTAVCLGLTLTGMAVFWRRSLRHTSPVVEPALLRVPSFAWSNATALAFTAAFAAGLLATVMWLQEVWGYSALRTGMAITPGPLMVPLFASLAQAVAHKVPAGWITAVGSALFGTGIIVLQLSLGAQPAYLTQALPGWLLSGMGVGLALPTILAAATADLPNNRAATGSAIVNMSRQLGAVLGVSILIALVSVPHTYTATHAAFTLARWTIAAVAFVGALTALRMTPRSTPSDSASAALTVTPEMS
ncbi:MFS transporter [Streptomyces sp. NBC_01724]|uniref:MFS transporter n=1 Tax=unclassified Streptomyces TaxID=2593676 RepID=UPI0028C39EB1|nr:MULTISPECIES: MFS transporter [unclassified Streptomyces]WNO62361.1 MFS transporter [Streptomyces sp. AM2-3-1]WNO69585.1 MFS transporter [Streptomyces sp. AM2-3-1]